MSQPTFPSAWVADAFGRYRTSEPLTVFDSKLLHGKEPVFWREVF